MLHLDRFIPPASLPRHAIIPPERVAHRYWPSRALPPYRYIPGGPHPHPVRDPDGHSYERNPRFRYHPPWDPNEWRTLESWLWGVDLFNTFYFWEAHEAWEVLWVVKPKDSPPALLLQGLIQVAAALLKVHTRSIGPAAALSREGLEKIALVAATTPTLLGLRLDHVRAAFTNYFRPLAERTLPRLDASVPALTLAGELAA